MKEYDKVKDPGEIKLKCRKCGHRIYLEKEKKRLKCNFCFDGEQNIMVKFLPGTKNLRLKKKPGFCSKCERPLKKKLDKRIGKCEFCRERQQNNMKKYVRVKK